MSATAKLAIELDMARIAAACRSNHVVSLDLFGSAATERFDADRSDIDLLVSFDVPAGQSALDPFFALRTSLEEILGHKVDLVLKGEMKNPYFRAAVERERIQLYP